MSENNRLRSYVLETDGGCVSGRRAKNEKRKNKIK